MSEYENLRLEVNDYIGVVTLDRPPVNAISMELYRDIASVFGEINGRTDEIRVVILTGAGRCFCAGRDLKQAETSDWDTRSNLAKASYSALFHCSVPVIAAVNGPAMGAGFVTSVLCDMVIASEDAVFCMPEIDAGLNMSVATILRAFTQHQAREIAFTGEKLSPHDLYRMGMVKSVVPQEELMSEATKLASLLASKSPLALREAKWSANEVEIMFSNFELAYRAIESRSSKALFNTEDRIEAGRAFREKRPPVFKGR